jgi:hypothetical protein
MPAKKKPTTSKLEKPVLPAVEPPDPVKRKASPAKPKKAVVAAPKKAAPAKPAVKKTVPAKVQASGIVEAPDPVPATSESTLPQLSSDMPAPAAPLPTAPAPVSPVAPIPPVAPAAPASSARPGQVQAIAIITLVNGIISILWGLGATAALLGTLICWPLGAYPIVTGIFEIIYAAKLLNSNPYGVKPANYVAIMEICEILFGNPFALVGGILSLVFYNDPAVKAYFVRINTPA